ncbi:ICP18.5-like protein [Gallid alphaherpesvirus 3]|uniref:ICP18.5-like protein n=3 Tax=Mardivirus TaxID=180252 RepID=F8TC21_9ALPH|nr:ICP18.5-like protein [Gallid alphaherpesvirus 3]AEI00232.1 ICP18.5-like protein [Gallid alphaherpesvirus 3]QEY02226.1 ICP18.5-like protein [Gallid alphaherpesvirus 3]BAA83752.1 homolog of HSV-1 ICP18.5 [Gallid alphaherpesvirus 2]
MPHGNAQALDVERDSIFASQKLLAVWGQLQSYLFQVELLKRCDPRVGVRMIKPLKLNVLMVRYLENLMAPGLTEQLERNISPLSYGLWLALRRARLDGEVLLRALCEFTDTGDVHGFFIKSMTISGDCPYHEVVELDTYGGSVRTEIKFLHDVENILKQLNYCHLIVKAGTAENFMLALDRYLIETLGAGSVVSPELCDPSQPCSVCFEELCVTANSGDSAHKRIIGKICNHVTKQIVLRVHPDDMVAHIPHAACLSDEKRSVVQAALSLIRPTRGDKDPGGSGDTVSVADAATAVLDAHNVFLPASGNLYAISELQFWIASSERKPNQPRANTIDSFADNLEDLAFKERLFDLRTSVVEMTVFGRRMDHFERVFAQEIENMNAADRLLLGGRAVAPDDIIEALIRACYDHHMSTPLLKRLLYPEEAAQDALKTTLEQVTSHSTRNGPLCQDGDGAPEDDFSNSEHLRIREGVTPLPDVREHYDWLELVRSASADVARRRKMYAERLSKRSLASLDKCITEQRKELEKMLRVNVYGEILIDSYTTLFNGFRSRNRLLEAIRKRCTNIIDNRITADAFDAHRFMQTSLLKHRIDPAMLPSLTHKFFRLLNGPMFNHDVHRFAQPSNTALYFSVENVGLLPHLKEEIARFMIHSCSSSDWIVSKFRGFYDFDGIDSITAAHRMAWKYIKEVILATTLFSSAFSCGELHLRRADCLPLNVNVEYIWEDGIYVTYETECPLITVLGAESDNVTVILDADVFSLLYSILQYMAPAAADQIRAERTNHDHTPT